MAASGSRTQKITKKEIEEKESLQKKRSSENLALNALQGKVVVSGDENFQVQQLIQRFNEVIRPKSGKDIQKAVMKIFYDGEDQEKTD